MDKEELKRIADALERIAEALEQDTFDRRRNEAEKTKPGEVWQG